MNPRESEVERPDSQNAPHVKGSHVDGALNAPLSKQDLGDQVGAQAEEEIDTTAASSNHKPPERAGNPWKEKEAA
jgi:hypothetical protein